MKFQGRTLLAALLTLAVSAPHAWADSLRDNFRQIPLGEPVMMSTFGLSDAATICLLQPYQQRINAGGDVAEGLNARLGAKTLVSDEGHFTFLIDGTRGLQLERIKRSAQLDVLGLRDLPAAVSFPDGFVRAECAPGATAAVVKVVVKGRCLISFGTMH